MPFIFCFIITLVKYPSFLFLRLITIKLLYMSNLKWILLPSKSLINSSQLYKIETRAKSMS